ncbi:hypothetical protein Leef1_46 [Polaribacter phage Leef_1]|uniref:Uncharacterized protein n=1 Tax=Polaribacter phage Leef_1 TaxID=2745684 RepID=A0A8E4ZMU0_9CAUD|nr:hypothetical protein M1M28_gp46 [Polaribacter phage Leef_1]QQV91412.1 hypothetical protein Leef1_46 [Polaribacter phage Leef_1]
MEIISNWFKNSKNYNEGVAIYAMLPTKKTRVFKTLSKGKSNRNMSLLVSELRRYKNGTDKPKLVKKKIITPLPSKPITQKTINVEVERTAVTQESLQQEFSMVKIGDLPAELRIRYSKARNIFYDMIELKFQLNDLPAKAEDDALKIMLEIDSLDEERDLIWKELHHWNQFKTILPSTVPDYEKMEKYDLDKTRRNLESSKSKQQKRVDQWYSDLENEPDKHQQHLIENKINKGEKEIHQKNINIKKIKSLL